MKRPSINHFSIAATIFLALLVLSFGLFVRGNDDRSPNVDYRYQVMEAVGAHMEAIVAIVRKEVEHVDHLSSHANALESLAVITPDIFPEGSEGGDALPAIWKKPDDFKKKLKTFVDSASTFASAAKKNDPKEIEARLRDLGQSCRNCHRSYRKR